jgi:hypothetical protein
MKGIVRSFVSGLALGAGLLTAGSAAAQAPEAWQRAFPETDFGQHSVPFSEIQSGGVPKDGIPSIDKPEFAPVEDRRKWLADREPVIGVSIAGDARAYPLRVMTWHEIVNDTIGGVPVAVTYCPLCNAAIVLEARLEGRRLTFGTTGKLRYSDLIMYDRQTGSWWQQFTGRGIVGEHTGRKLDFMPARLESWAEFRDRHPDGRVLVPNDPDARPYGRNPYAGYDSAHSPFLYRGPMPEKVPPMARVIVVGDEAWSLELVRTKRRIETDDHIISWASGQASALDTPEIADGREVGTVSVYEKTPQGRKNAVYDVTFAFVFKAFHPDGTWHVGEGD